MPRLMEKKAWQKKCRVQVSTTDENEKKGQTKMKQCLLIAVSMLILVGFCDDAELVKVRGRGLGTNKMEALKDAYRDAVEQAVGLYVDAEQMVQNEDLVKDQILTQSNAYIEKYKIAKESTEENGLITVTILADVRKRALTRKIRDVMPSSTIDLSGISKDLHAQIVTDFRANDDALAIIRNELRELRPFKLMKVTLGTTKPIAEPVKEEPSMVRLWYPVKFEVDDTKYYKEFVPRWTRILEQIKTSPVKRMVLKNELSLIKAYNTFIQEEYGSQRKGKTGVMTRCEDKSEDSSWVFHKDIWPLAKTGLALNEEYNRMCFLSTIIEGKTYILHGLGCSDYYKFTNKIDSDAFHKAERYVRRVFIKGEDNFGPLSSIPEGCNFGIALVKSARGNMLQGNIYNIPYECVCEIVKWQNEVILGNAKCGDSDDPSLVKVTYSLCFSDAKADEIAAMTFTVNNIDISNFACVVLDEGDYPDYLGSRKWLVTPLVGGVAQSYVKWVNVDLPKDDVAKIANATISVEE